MLYNTSSFSGGETDYGSDFAADSRRLLLHRGAGWLLQMLIRICAMLRRRGDAGTDASTGQ